MVIPMGPMDGDPMGGGGMAPPSEQLKKWILPVQILMTLMVAVTITRLVIGGDGSSNAFQALFVVIAGLCIICKPDSMMVTCLLPFLLLAGLALLFDLFGFIEIMSSTQPGVAYIFATSCPLPQTIQFPYDQSITNSSGTYTITAGKYTITQNLCDFDWAFGNALFLAAIVLDFLSTYAGWKMLKVNRADQTDPANLPLAGPGGGAGMLGPNSGGGGAGGAPPSSGGGGGAVMPVRGPGFQPFGGQGQTLGSG